MPSMLHEALVLLFQKRPTLAPELVRDVLRQPLPAYDNVEVRDANLGQIVPTEYHADLVVLLYEGAPVFGIVVEVQLGIDEDKPYTWPLYATALRAKHRCPTCVMVVTPDAHIATWAARPIAMGPGTSFVPLVLGPSAVPWVTDAEEARRAPELAVLSAQAHGTQARGLEVAMAALAAASGLDEERATLYYDLVYLALSEATRSELEKLMQSRPYEYHSEFARKHIAIGRTEGKAEGIAEAILGVFDARAMAIPAEIRQRIEACEDLDALRRWHKRAVVAAIPADIFDER
jgi:hypothetical protein